MKRRNVTVRVVASDGSVIHEATKYAWNAAIRESEAGVREHARSRGEAFEAGKPSAVVGQAYERIWTGCRSGTQVSAIVVGPDFVMHTCPQCGERFTLPQGIALTRGSRPCGWSH